MVYLLAVVASMERELVALAGSRSGDVTRDGAGSLVHLHVTGVGKDRALSGIHALLQRPDRPDAILSLGFAGALNEGLETGDLVLAQRLYATGEESFLSVDDRLLKLTQESIKNIRQFRHSVADSLTVPQPVVTAAAKDRLARATTAWVVNMEDYWIAKGAAEAGIPFISVRAVVDTARQNLPGFVAGLGRLGPMGQALQAGANAIVRPWSVPGLLKLSKQVRVAQEGLGSFVAAFVSRLTLQEIEAISGSNEQTKGIPTEPKRLIHG